MDSARSTNDFEKTDQQKQFSEINGRISPQIDKISVNTKPRVEEDWCQAAKITKDEIFDGNVEREGSTVYGVDGDKDFPFHSCKIELPKLSKTESEVPGELSETNALDFVDHYLSVYNNDTVNEVEARGANKIISPPFFSRLGPQKLASRMNVQHAVKNSGVFDWPERQSDNANGSFSRHQKILTYHRKNYGLKKQKVSSIQSSEEPMKSMTDLNKAEPKFLAEGNTNVESNFLRKSNEQFDMGAFEQEVDYDGNRSDGLDTYDVGLDTQLAAEAMETLLHAPPLKSDVVSAPPIPKASQVKEEEYPERAISREFNIDDSSPEPTLCSSAEIELLRGKTRGFSSVVHITKHQVSLNLRSLENPTTNSITDCNFPKKKRKQHEAGALNDNLLQVAAVRGEVSKSGTNKSRKARKVSMSKRGETFQSLAATLSQVKLVNWVCKGKRTHKRGRRLSNGSSNLHPLLISADQGNHFQYPVLNHKAEKRRHPLEFKRQNQSSCEKTQSGLLSIQSASRPYSSICKYSVTTQKMTPMDFERTESAKLNEMILTKDMKSDVMSNGISDPSYCLNNQKKGKQHIRSLSKSPLSQELIRLGYAAQLPDFLPRCSRRRKGAGDICILFSQSLDIKLIKQQKKVLFPEISST